MAGINSDPKVIDVLRNGVLIVDEIPPIPVDPRESAGLIEHRIEMGDIWKLNASGRRMRITNVVQRPDGWSVVLKFDDDETVTLSVGELIGAATKD